MTTTTEIATTEVGLPKAEVYVALDVVWKGAAGKFDSRMSEISREGCFIESMGQEVLGETIDFNVHLPSGIWVTLQGEVVYSEYPIGFEARFTNLTDENRRLLMRVVAAHGGALAQQMLKEEDERMAAERLPGDLGRVLVADDDPVTLEVVKAIIEGEGYSVVCASDGLEAFRILKGDADFCAVIFDMMMPHLNGLGLIQYSKSDERLKQMPIGLITAEQDPKIWDDTVAAGASVFLLKPFSPPQIQMMLRMLVKNIAAV